MSDNFKFKELLPKDLYHSYVIESESGDIASALIRFLEERKEIGKNSKDVFLINTESFTVDNARIAKDWHSKSKIEDGKKILIINTKVINREAEQALLKMIEEPSHDSHIFLIIPNSSHLQKTTLSRVHVIKIDEEINEAIRKEVNNFVKMSARNRLDLVAKIIKENKDEEGSGKLKSYVTNFVNELENIFYQKFKKDIKDKKVRFILDELEKSRGYLRTQGASVKMILEHIALVI